MLEDVWRKLAKILKICIMIYKAIIIIGIGWSGRVEGITKLIVIDLRHANLQMSWIRMKGKDGLEDLDLDWDD